VFLCPAPVLSPGPEIQSSDDPNEQRNTTKQDKDAGHGSTSSHQCHHTAGQKHPDRETKHCHQCREGRIIQKLTERNRARCQVRKIGHLIYQNPSLFLIQS
jgi:hypothetical protein